jgi:RHS repeat-associated protein
MTLSYDPAGRLRRTVVPSGSAGTPTNWGAANWGAFQWSGATYVTEDYAYDGDRRVIEYDGAGNIIRRYVPGQSQDETLVWYEGGGLSSPRWLHTDQLGSVVSTSDASGNGTVYTYSATGEPSAWGAPGTSPAFRYTGQVALPQVQLMYYKARMYDPALGRFLQTDPAGYSQGLNLYAYALNNYPNATDPSGEVCSFAPDYSNFGLDTLTCTDTETVSSTASTVPCLSLICTGGGWYGLQGTSGVSAGTGFGAGTSGSAANANTASQGTNNQPPSATACLVQASARNPTTLVDAAGLAASFFPGGSAVFVGGQLIAATGSEFYSASHPSQQPGSNALGVGTFVAGYNNTALSLVSKAEAPTLAKIVPGLGVAISSVSLGNDLFSKGGFIDSFNSCMAKRGP